MLNLGFIITALQNLSAYFFSGCRHKTQALWFRRAVYFLLLVKCLYWLYYFRFFFGEHPIIYARPFSSGPLNDLAFILYNHQIPSLNAAFIICALAISLLRLFYNKLYLVPDLIAWLITVNIHNQVYASLSGGDFLLNQFLLFNCFLSLDDPSNTGSTGQIRTLLHNLGALAVIVQMCLAYFLSSLAKLNNDIWLSGNAITIVIQTEHFSLHNFPGYDKNLGWLYATINYLTLAYQTAFPVLVWIKRFKKAFLLTGVAMHLYIGLVMGLPMFSLTMITGYILFWPFKES